MQRYFVRLRALLFLLLFALLMSSSFTLLSTREAAHAASTQQAHPIGATDLSLFNDNPSIIKVPGATASWCFDLLTYDAQSHRVYLSDETHGVIQVFDLRTHQLLAPIGKGLFSGPGKCTQFDFSQEGPNGNLVVDGRLVASNGDSTVKVFALPSGKLIKSLSTGGTLRADEMTYDQRDHLLFVTNPDESVPFLTAIDMRTLTIRYRLSFPHAQSLEQPVWNPSNDLVYLAVPSTDTHPGGEIDVLRPVSHQIVHVFPLTTCNPNGLALGREEVFAVGCGSDPVTNAVNAAQIFNARNGQAITVPQSTFADVVASSPSGHQFAFTSLGTKQPAVVLTNSTGKVMQSLPTDALAHVVAFAGKHTLVVPVGSFGGVAFYMRQEDK